MKLMVLMVPLILVSGFVVIFGLRSTTTSSWDFIARQPAWLWWGHGNSSLNGASSVTVHAKESDESPPLINGFSPPPQAVEALPFEEPNVLKQDVSETSGPIAAPANEALDLARKTRHKTEHTSLEKLEAGLQKARVALKEAKNGKQADDPDYAPAGPMYWNAEVFHRSIYSMEGNFIHRMEIDGHFRTKDPDKAHVYFLPFSVAMMVRFVYERESRDFGPIRRTVSDYINLISGKYPFWNRSLGADHFMLACHDWGPEASFSVPHLGKISIRALCNANTSEKFNPIKDVSLPEINLRTGSIKGFVGGLSPSKRSILAFFAGRLHGPIRPVVLEHWENKDDDIKVHQQLPKGVSYYEMMRGSKFCLCPSGYEVASPRIVEALYAGCVPVLISDHYVPPFSDVLNWKSFSVEVPVSDIPSLKKILTSISPRQYIRMQRRVLQVRRHFEVNSPPKRFDVFHMILHSIWLRRLNVGIHDDQLAITS
ncbi:probable glycosyltransferase At5g03795 isoform X2 [Populus trichocarpa]|uniref:Exostosin GT47 domain-containing protein n=1 Tax=Populus trichocarpa TaxID=3694 RepID=A0A2K2A0S5_POPTR|nr:probable glycosyltransferase At5g03795 isoform X2 [Populus trichocarpa]|eukprot:XP_024459282.1 probable glycosyltransferase At5g03795 isoform X2 [Populus trichocarpa]